MRGCINSNCEKTLFYGQALSELLFPKRYDFVSTFCRILLPGDFERSFLISGPLKFCLSDCKSVDTLPCDTKN